MDETLVRIIRGNVREPDQLIGDIYALATCNEIGHRRLIDMMQEFDCVTLTALRISSSTIPARHAGTDRRPAPDHGAG